MFKSAMVNAKAISEVKMNITSMAKTLFASVKIAPPSKNSGNVEKNHQKDQNDKYKSNKPINFQPHFLKSPHIFTLNKHYYI